MTEVTPLQDRTNTYNNGGGSDRDTKPKLNRKPGYARDRAHKALSNVDKEFKGKEESIGVIGVSGKYFGFSCGK